MNPEKQSLFYIYVIKTTALIIVVVFFFFFCGGISYMLDSYKQEYEKCADAYVVENWRKMNKNELVNRYIEVESNPKLANAYMSAIICRYWGALSKYHYSSSSSVDKFTYHDWLVGAILRAVKNRKWLEPGNKLYGDPNGPDKVINRCIISERLGFFQSSNTYKRRQNYGIDSIDRLQEENADSSQIPSYVPEEIDEGNLSIKQLISDSFDKKEYITAFLIDGIINYDVFEQKGKSDLDYSIFSEKKLLRHLRALNVAYSRNFAQIFDKPIEEVELAVNECTSLTRTRLKTAVNRSMKKLTNHYNQILKEY